MRARLAVLVTMWLAVLVAQGAAATITAIPRESGSVLITVEGELKSGDVEIFQNKISNYSSGFVVLESDGGEVTTGILIGRIIRLRNFATWVLSGSRCASACALAWLGGTPKIMGKQALVGFHAAYRTRDGSESGMANALVGKYLSDLGLSFDAIAYLTAAPPSSMTWITEAEAAKVGISINVVDPESKTATAQPSPSIDAGSQLRRNATDFLRKLYVAVSAPNNTGLIFLSQSYGETVTYFGKVLPRDRVMEQIATFVDRWPEREYKPRENSTEILCNADNLTCTVKGVLDFDARSSARNERSAGSATFEFGLKFTTLQSGPRISTEGGAVLTRSKDPLIPPTPRAQSRYRDP